MSQIDLENVVSACAGGDSKIACETLPESTSDEDPSENDVIPVDIGDVFVDPDFPPESFWLSKDAEYDWFDRNAFYYERKDSTKGNSISTSLNTNSNFSSQRFSVSSKSKAAIIGLPKTQKNTYIVDPKRRSCKPANVKMFPKRIDPVGKSITEPGSPKVSCIGRVRSKRCRRRSNSLKKSTEKKKSGIYSKVMNIFRSKKGGKKSSRSGSRKVAYEPVFERRSESTNGKKMPISGDQAAAEPPAFGAAKRFTSGRRSGSWTDDDFKQTFSAPLDRRVGEI